MVEVAGYVDAFTPDDDDEFVAVQDELGEDGGQTGPRPLRTREERISSFFNVGKVAILKTNFWQSATLFTKRIQIEKKSS